MAEQVPIEVERVTKTFPGVTALADVSFRISLGERACLLGPNGAGKTTLIRLLSGALRATEGAVRLFGAGVESPRYPDAKRRVGIVPQSPGMYRDLTAGEYLGFEQRLNGRGAVGRVVEAFGLGASLERRMAQLSGGTQRRLSLAAALLGEPEMLLLDEPTAGLDPLVTREVHEFLRGAMAGRTVLLCTHDLDEAEALCESAVILQQGKVRLHERIAALRAKTRPAVLIGAREGAQAAVAALGRLGIPAELAGERARISLDEPEARMPELLRDLMAAGLSVYEARIEAASLEDMFLQLVDAGARHAA